MRIISILVTLLVFFAVFAPKSLAAETNTDETQTNTKVIILDDGRIYGEDGTLSNIPHTYADIKALSDEEIKREEKLARFKDRLENAILPEGQFAINASAYTAAADECGKSDGITASGLKVKENRTLACPPQFPFGVKIKIDGMGIYVCEDRGGAIKGNHFDIYMQTKEQAFDFGRRNLLAEVVK